MISTFTTFLDRELRSYKNRIAKKKKRGREFMPSQGYIRYPSIFHDQIVFVSEDDLWLVSADGGRAERLTAGVGEVSSPRFSPDGQQVAFVGREEGPSEVYLMPALGDEAARLTFQASSCKVVGWMPDGSAILYASNADQFTGRFEAIHAISPQGGLPRVMPFGAANAVSYGPHGGVVLGRNMHEPAYWKRYRGGTAGHLWCDVEGSGTFKRLLHLKGNIASPCWVGDRLYFLSDHEGVGNIYSCTPEGEDLRRHSAHEDFYARNLSTDGQRLVYHAGADLYLFDPAEEQVRHLEVSLPSMRTQRQRKFVSAMDYLGGYALHPQGHSLALTTRGKAFHLGNWEGPVVQQGEQDGVRYRFLQWLHDSKRQVAVCDAPGREALVLFDPEQVAEPRILADIEFGRVLELKVSPTEEQVALTNHRNELMVVDVGAERARVLDRSDFGNLSGVSWSPDGRWVAYGAPISLQKTAIKLCRLEDNATYQVTNPVLRDVAPSFDPDGKYLYFLGYRIFNPVYDHLQFDLSFPRGAKPYAIMLCRDLRSPFIAEPHVHNGKDKDKEEQAAKKVEEDKETKKEETTRSEGEKKNGAPSLTIDLDGIAERVLPFPVTEGRYRAVRGIKGKALFLAFPTEDASAGIFDEQHAPRGYIDSYDFERYKSERLIDGVTDFDLSSDGKWLIYRSGQRMRVIKAGEKPEHDEENPGRESGWLSLNRVKVSVQPAAEWRQMFAEAWRLQREQFWNEEMSGVDWDAAYARYAPLIDRVTSRSELSDLLWELQGELGTSHAYEIGGEYRESPHYRQGFLGVTWAYDEAHERFRIARIVKGDTADLRATSPLTSPGLDIAEGDAVLAVNGQRVGPHRTPQELLVNQAGQVVQLTIEDAETSEVRTVTIKTLHSDYPARYRDWVEHNRQYVHERSNHRVGYIHIPDMGGNGFAEFHRSFLTEYDYPALLVDVRWNSGGHVSGLLLEKLARRRLGYDFSRWGQPEPYPNESPRGPMVALTNEHAGSDGDIFCHSFKLMGLGPLLGMRTWGGVIGIAINHSLVDGTVTTQPEYASWFKDVGCNVENYGIDPDIEVDIAPQDFVQAADPQLDRAITEALRLADEQPSLEPKPGERPKLGRPLLTSLQTS
jgi:tricorn protease